MLKIRRYRPCKPYRASLRDKYNDGSKNAVKKMNLRSLKLYRVYLNILNLSKVGDFF